MSAAHKDDQVLDLGSEKYSGYHSAILLASVALSAFAGAAAAEVSLTWGGTATVGMAREGGADAGLPNKTMRAFADADIVGDEVAAAQLDIFDRIADLLDAETNGTASSDIAAAAAEALADIESPTAAQEDAADLAAMRAYLKEQRTIASSIGLAADAEALADFEALLDEAFGTVAVDTGDFDSYAEANLTATLSVATDYGITVTGAVSVDAGTGYDFADDDGFDSSKADTSVGLDYITIDGGSFGALTFDKNDIAHLVDDDDDETGDLKYTNDFGVASFAFVMDIAKDGDAAARRAGFEAYAAADNDGLDAVDDAEAIAANNAAVIAGYDLSTTNGGTAGIGYNAAVAADVAWSAMISAPIADMGTVYAAFDEEGGNAFGGSFMVANVTIGLDSKLEALEEELGEDRSNTISLAYAVDGLSLGAEWNSVEDGNQWAVNAAYAANGMAVAFDTNEAEEWTATASYDLSDAASVDLGVNYTEDAFVGLSLAF